MVKKVSNDIYHSASFTFLILKFLGLAPYRFDRKTLSFQMDVWNYFVFITSVIICMIMIWFSFEKSSFNSGVQSSLLENLRLYQYLMQHYLPVVAIIFVFYQRKKIEHFFKLIYKFDESIKTFGWAFKVTHSRYFGLIVFMSSTFLMLFYVIMTVFVIEVYKDAPHISKAGGLLRSTAYIIINEFYLMVSMQFILSTYCVYARLKALIKNAR